MAVSKRLRFEILCRDNHACRYCGGVAPDVVLTIDHVVPIALGGTDEPTNLIAACRECNAGKSSVPADAGTVADVAQDALRWAAAIEEVARQADQRREARRRWHDWFEEVWAEWSYGGAMKKPFPLDIAWQDSIDRFQTNGVTADDMTDAVRTAMSRGHVTPDAKFRYFCGICWNIASDRQEQARTLLVDDDRTADDLPPMLDAEDYYALHQFSELLAVVDGSIDA